MLTKDRRTFHGLLVTVERGVPTERGEGMRVTMPDGSERIAVPDDDHPTMDAAASWAVNKWRVKAWRAQGARGEI